METFLPGSTGDEDPRDFKYHVVICAKVGLIRIHPTSRECDTALHLLTAALFQCPQVAEC